MSRRWVVYGLIVMGLTLVLAGCGSKDAESVISDLEKQVSRLESYVSTGTMTLNTGAEPQEYQVEVAYQKPSYYRIALNNEQKQISQIVLKNDDGVFVLTPHQNKSFRFQSDWPDGQGQVYLYESLVNSIVGDESRQFTIDGDAYVFDVQANYANATLSRQKIWINKESLAPETVQIYDAQNNPVVIMAFTNFRFDETLDREYFDMQRNMTGARLTLPTLGLEGGTGDGAADGTTPNSQLTGSAQQDVTIIEPGYIPDGVNRPDISDTMLGENKAVLLRYTGLYNYTLMESRPTDKSASFQNGDLIDLGYSFALLTGNDSKTMIWMYQGTEFRLASAELPVEEMINIAISVQGQSAK